MDFITKDHQVIPLNNGSGVSSSIIGSPTHSGNSTPSIKQESHNNRLQNFLKSRHVAHTTGKLVGTAIAKKKQQDELKREMKKQLDNQIDSIIDDKGMSPKTRFRMLQRFHFENRKRLTNDQKHAIRQEIQTLMKNQKVAEDASNLKTKDEYKTEQKEELVQKRIMHDKNPNPVTFADTMIEEPIEVPPTPSDEKRHDGISERLTEETIGLQVKH